MKLKRLTNLIRPNYDDYESLWSSDSGIRNFCVMLLISAVMVPLIPFASHAFISPHGEGTRGSGQVTDKYQADLTAAVKSMKSEASRMKRTKAARDNFTRLAQKIQRVKTMPVIIRLRLPYSAEIEVAGGVEADAQRLMIKQVRERLLSQLVGYEASSVKSYDYLPMVALQINIAGMKALQELDDAFDIQEDEARSPSSDQVSPKLRNRQRKKI